MARVLALIAVLALVGCAAAWGADGHQIVGQIGANFLTSTTTSQISKQLGSNTLASIATWPDNYDHQSNGEWSGHLHYVNLDVSDLKFNYSACVPPSTNPAGCVITAITNYTVILQNNLQNNYNAQCVDNNSEPCPLSFLTHFLGDSHQPLHVAYEIDEGGNSFQATYEGSCTQLHSIWDSRLLYTYEDDNDFEWNDVAQQITAWLRADSHIIDVFTNTTSPEHWGDQTFAIARLAPYNLSPGTAPPAANWMKSLYNYTDPMTTNFFEKEAKQAAAGSSSCGPTLGFPYYQRTIPVVFEQLAKSGCRLAYLLNSIFDPSFTGHLV